MRKIAFYVRVSTKEAAKRKEGSPKAQIQRLEMRLEDKNRYNQNKWGRLVDIYRDDARSGKDTNRPEYQRMLGDIASGKIDTVMVTELSRINRSVIDFLAFMKYCRDHGGDFVCLQYEFDTTTPMGKMLITIMAALYEFEREQTIERIKNNNFVRALRGLLNGGSPILGYDRDPNNTGTRLLNAKEAEDVKTLFGLYDTEGRTLADVLRIANTRGIYNKGWITKNGEIRGSGSFSRTSLYNLLVNKSYIAVKEVNRENVRENQEELKEEERYQTVPAPWPAIISTELFDRVQMKLQSNREGSRDREDRNYDYILTGILYCDECGRPLVGQTGHGAIQDHYYYSHSQTKQSECRIIRYSAPKLEALIKNEMSSLISNSNDVQAFVSTLQKVVSSGAFQMESQLAQLKREADEVENRKRNLLNVISANTDAGQIKAVLEELKRLESRLTDIEDKKEDLKIQKTRANADAPDSEYVLNAIKRFMNKGFEKSEISEKKVIVKELFKSIHIHPDNVIRLNVWSSKTRVQNQAKRSTQIEGSATEAVLNDSTAYLKAGIVIPFEKKEDLKTKKATSGVNTPGVACSLTVKDGWSDWG